MSTKLHKHEKRFGFKQDTRSLSCAIYRCTPPAMLTVKPLLLYEMQFQYCIVCAAKHWVLGDRIEEEKPARRFQRMEITGYE